MAPLHASTVQLGVYMMAGGLGAVLPDIDSSKSKIGRKLPGLSHMIESVAGHRKVFHSLPGTVGLFGMAYVLLKVFHPSYLIVLLPLLVGYLSHLVINTPTNGGIPWLYPFKKERLGPHLETNGSLERWVFRPVAVAGMFFRNVSHVAAGLPKGHTERNVG